MSSMKNCTKDVHYVQELEVALAPAVSCEKSLICITSLGFSNFMCFLDLYSSLLLRPLQQCQCTACSMFITSFLNPWPHADPRFVELTFAYVCKHTQMSVQ